MLSIRWHTLLFPIETPAKVRAGVQHIAVFGNINRCWCHRVQRVGVGRDGAVLVAEAQLADDTMCCASVPVAHRICGHIAAFSGRRPDRCKVHGLEDLHNQAC